MRFENIRPSTKKSVRIEYARGDSMNIIARRHRLSNYMVKKIVSKKSKSMSKSRKRR